MKTLPAIAVLLLALCAPAAAAPTARLVPEGEAIPDQPLYGLFHDYRKFSEFRGKPLIINVWASWCGPCRAEMPSLELLAARHAADGLQVMAVNFRETDAAVARFVDQTALSLPVLRDLDGAVAASYGVRVFPGSVAIGRDGRARFFVVGEVDWTGPDARRWIAPLLSPR